jgi:hypothetical protein
MEGKDGSRGRCVESLFRLSYLPLTSVVCRRWLEFRASRHAARAHGAADGREMRSLCIAASLAWLIIGVYGNLTDGLVLVRNAEVVSGPVLLYAGIESLDVDLWVVWTFCGRDGIAYVPVSFLRSICPPVRRRRLCLQSTEFGCALRV